MMTLIYASLAWSLIAFLLYSVFTSLQQGLSRIRHLHQIRCSECLYYTHCPVLKCTIHPQQALTEATIVCPDFAPVLEAE